MNEQPLDLRATLQSLRRRWRLAAAVLALGVLLGSVVALRSPPIYVARSGVLLPAAPRDTGGRPLRNMDTEVSIAASAAVLDGAGRRLEPPASVRTLRQHVRVRAASPDILDIRSEAHSPRRAAEIANVVAEEYVEYSSGASSEDAQVETDTLREQADELARRIRQYDEEITAGTRRLNTLNALSPDRVLQESRLEALKFAQLDAARQLSALDTRIAEAQLNAALTRRGLRLLEPSIPPTDPVRSRLLAPIGLGGLAGLLTGIVLALALERRNDRIWSRREIAQAVGAPVLLSMALPRRFRDKDCRALYSQWSPSAVDRHSLVQAFARLRSLVVGRPHNLVLVALPGDKPSVFLALHVAIFSARSGTPTVLRLPERDETCEMVRAACSSAARSEPSACPNLQVTTNDADGENLAKAHHTFAVTLLIAGNGPLNFPVSRDITLSTLVVSSGFATTEELASVALGCLEAGYPISGVFVSNPDANDRTTGHLPEPLPIDAHGPQAGTIHEPTEGDHRDEHLDTEAEGVGDLWPPPERSPNGAEQPEPVHSEPDGPGTVERAAPTGNGGLPSRQAAPVVGSEGEGAGELLPPPQHVANDGDTAEPVHPAAESPGTVEGAAPPFNGESSADPEVPAERTEPA